MNRKLLRKALIILFIQLVVYYISLYSIFFDDTVILKIANSISSNAFVIGSLLIIFSVLGLTYKNKKTFFKSWHTIFVCIGLLTTDSIFISEDIVHINKDLYLCGVSLFSFILLAYMEIHCIYPIELKFQKHSFNELTDNNTENQIIYNPIDSKENLYPSRIIQLESIEEYIKSCSSNSKCSICLDGEYGSGKTSFVNALSKELQSNNYNIISINTIAIDSFETLLNYFFGRIRYILENNGIYIGANSEYKEILTELMKMFSSNSIGTLLNFNTPKNDDYRDILKKLNDLLRECLGDTKIVVIVDDIERCPKETALQYLFLLKELSMLHGCISLFITDYSELKMKCKYDDTFFEKFFNHIFNLSNVDYYEIVSYHGFSDAFKEKVDNILQTFNSRIKDLDIILASPEENQDNQNKIASFNIIKKTLTNPRKIQRIYDKYSYLKNLVDKYANNKINNLNQLDYEKQLIKLSIIYVVDNNSFSIIERKGIYDFLYYIDNSQEFPERDAISYLSEEWNDSENYLSDKISFFIYYLFIDPTELQNILNGYSSKQEEYISKIEKNELPDNNFLDVMNELFMAVNSGNNLNDIIKNAFQLYKDDHLTFDEALKALSSNTLQNNINKLNISQSFYETFCNDNIDVINPFECTKLFITSQRYILLNELGNILRYFYCLIDIDSEKRNQLGDIPLHYDNTEDSLKAYNGQIISLLPDFKSSGKRSIDVLKELIAYADDFYKKEKMSEFHDIKSLRNQIGNRIEQIKYLQKIEKFINQIWDTTKNKTRNIYIDEEIENVTETIDNIFISINDKSLFKRVDFEYTNRLFLTIEKRNLQLSNDSLRKLSKIIEHWSKDNNTPYLWWRKIYYIASKKTKEQAD